MCFSFAVSQSDPEAPLVSDEPCCSCTHCHFSYLAKRWSMRTSVGKVTPCLSRLTDSELSVLMICCYHSYHNQNDQPYWAESDTTLPPVVLALPV